MARIKDLIDPAMLLKIQNSLSKSSGLEREYPIQRSSIKNEIIIKSLRDSFSVSPFIYCIRQVLNDGYKKVILNFTDVIEGQYPNACVPIAATIQFFKRGGIDFEFIGDRKIFPGLSITEPKFSSIDEPMSNEIFSQIWEFRRASTIHSIIEHFVFNIGKIVVCSSGVLHAMEWCLCEVMDNVLQHSEAGCGFVMAQYHPFTKKISICIADTGIGILESLSRSRHKPKDAVDAINLAVQERVTRDPDIGQGNGLWGLLQIVHQNKGSLSIFSGKGGIVFTEGHQKSYDKLLCISLTEHQGTTVDFQLDAGTPVDVGLALKNDYATNFTFESLEDSKRNATLNLKDFPEGYGTRESGEKMRNLILNLLNEGSRRVVINFDSVDVVSSSFADECLGKLAFNMGMKIFRTKIALLHVNTINQGIINKAIVQRTS